MALSKASSGRKWRRQTLSIHPWLIHLLSESKKNFFYAFETQKRLQLTNRCHICFLSTNKVDFASGRKFSASKWIFSRRVHLLASAVGMTFRSLFLGQVTRWSSELLLQAGLTKNDRFRTFARCWLSFYGNNRWQKIYFLVKLVIAGSCKWTNFFYWKYQSNNYDSNYDMLHALVGHITWSF